MLFFCDKCTHFIRESLKESIILPWCFSDHVDSFDSFAVHCDYSNHHLGISFPITDLMMKSTNKGLKLTNDSRRKLLKALKNIYGPF